MAHRPWSTILLVCDVGMAAVGGVACVFALAGVGADLSSHTDMFDGLAAALYGALAATALAIGGGAATLASFTRRGRRKADAGNPRMLEGAGIGSLVLGGLLLVALLAATVIGVGQGSTTTRWLTPALLVAGLYVAAAVQSLRAANR